MKFDYTRMVNADPLAVSQAVMGVADGVQGRSAEAQVMAAALFFLFVSEAHKVNPQDVFTAAKNLLARDNHDAKPQFAAAKAYVENEIAK